MRMYDIYIYIIIIIYFFLMLLLLLLLYFIFLLLLLLLLLFYEYNVLNLQRRTWIVTQSLFRVPPRLQVLRYEWSDSITLLAELVLPRSQTGWYTTGKLIIFGWRG